MSEVIRIAEIGALIGDPARANMLAALLDGRAHTAKELAAAAHVTAATASGHLARLLSGGLLGVARQGRHRYYQLSSPEVARMVEVIGGVARGTPPQGTSAPRVGAALREARSCYDHLAGRLAVAVADALAARGHLQLGPEGGEVTPRGETFFAALGLDLAAARAGRRAFCRPCLDWTERRPHIGGALGAALLCRCFTLGWAERLPGSRALRVTPAGRAGFAERFGVDA